MTEAFLAEHLGGRFEPIGDDFEGSSIQVPAGAADVPGLARSAAEAAEVDERRAPAKLEPTASQCLARVGSRPFLRRVTAAAKPSYAVATPSSRSSSNV